MSAAIVQAFQPDDALADLAIEAAVLGACMVDPRAIDLAAGLDAGTFADAAHARIFAAIAQRRGEGRAATATALRQLFIHDDSLADLGGAKYLAELAAGAAALVDVADYAAILADLAMRREALAAFAAGAASAQRVDLEGSALAVIDAAQGRLSEIGRKAAAAAATQPAGLLAEGVLADLDAIQAGEAPRGVTTGLICLDRAIGRLEPGELWILGARPAMGKSALALTMAAAIGASAGPAFVVSLEMGRRQIGRRLLAAYSGVSAFALRDGRVNAADRQRVNDAARRVAALDLDVYVDRDTSIEAVLAAARRAHRARPLAALFVDYLQLMRAGGGSRRDNRVQELSDITGALKTLALDLDIPVVALSQLNRGLENREDKRPNVADLRESGSIEQDADGVLMLHREEVYHMRGRPRRGAPPGAMADWQDDHDKLKGRAEIIVAKHRSGEAGAIVECRFSGATTVFYDPPAVTGDGGRDFERED